MRTMMTMESRWVAIIAGWVFESGNWAGGASTHLPFPCIMADVYHSCKHASFDGLS